MVQPVFCKVDTGSCFFKLHHLLVSPDKELKIKNYLIKNEGIGEHITAGGGKKINLLQDIKLQFVKPAQKKYANRGNRPIR